MNTHLVDTNSLSFLDSLHSAVVDGPEVPFPLLAIRLLIALVAGGLISLLYSRSRSGSGAVSLPATLVMLSVLIAAVTQVIGGNVARAFSLVGALSIVRFRTVVRDTRDTAFVIFVVVVGMAVGAGHSLVALMTLIMGGIAAWIMRPRVSGQTEPQEYELSLKVGLAQDVEGTTQSVFREHLVEWTACGASTARQGAALELVWHVTPRRDRSPADLVRALNRIEGVQGVELKPRDADF